MRWFPDSDRGFWATFAAICLLGGAFVVGALWLVDQRQPERAPLPDGCIVVDFNPSKGSYPRMVCLNESHPVPTVPR